MQSVRFPALFLSLALWVLPYSLKVSGQGTSSTTPPAAESWKLFLPAQVPWGAGFASLPPGARVAILEGDPSRDGFFTMRIEMPDGYRVAPHWHPRQERLTIISGTLMLGMGERFDEKTLKPLSPGTYSSMPPRMAHFAVARGQTVLQLSSIGPWAITYINSDDDPRNSKK